MSQYLGDISAYALAVSQGYTGTEEEYAELMASYATVGQTAVNAAQTATTKASEAATSATTATTKASEATTAATTATTKAGEASTSASTATSAKDTAVSASQTATTKATEATTAAATAVSAKDDAVSANTAAQSAKTAAQTAQTGAETAAASVQSSAAQIQTNADDISELKEDLTALDGVVFARNYRISLSSSNVVTGYYLDGTGKCVAMSGFKMLKYPVTPGTLIWIYASADSAGVYQFQSAMGVPSTLPNNNLVSEPVTTATNGIVVVPSNAEYCIISAAYDNADSGLYEYESVFKDAVTLKNLIGMDSTVKYPVYIPSGTTLTMSTADGADLGQSGLNFLTFDEDGNQAQYWNFSTFAPSRTITTSKDAHYIGWNVDPVKEVQVEIGATKTRYVPYALNIRDSNVVKKVVDSVTETSVINQSFNSAYHKGATDFAVKCTEFSTLMYGDTMADVSAPSDCESFLFFTDPHLLQWSGWESKCYEFIAQIQKYYNSTPTTFCLCGGDWLGNDDLPSVACYKLGYIDGFMHSMFDKCYMLVGNHDTNYQGKLTAESARFTTRLSNQSIIDLWYRKEGKSYFSFNGANTKFYCFDTGIESQALTALDNYGWEQAQWFANALTSDNSDHIAIASHILYNNLPTDSNVCPIMQEVLAIAEAYNDRSTIAVNGTTYDFTNATGKIEFCVCGHSHGDYNGILNGIPYFLTINADKLSDTASFDMVLIDYDNNVINLVRVGSGDNRTISLVTGQLVTE